MYAKLFSSILTSSIWSEDAETCKLWITLLALADREGYVFGSVLGLARQAALPLEAVEAGLARFMNPTLTRRTGSVREATRRTAAGSRRRLRGRGRSLTMPFIET